MSGAVFSDDYQKFVALLVDARKAAGMTQADLASRLSKPQSFISKIERSERRVDVVEFCRLAAALRVDPHRLLNDLVASLELSASVADAS